MRLLSARWRLSGVFRGRLPLAYARVPRLEKIGRGPRGCVCAGGATPGTPIPEMTISTAKEAPTEAHPDQFGSFVRVGWKN